RMITDSIKAEKNGLWGRAYVDGAHHTGSGLGDGDVWLQTVVDDLRHVGVPVVYDQKPETFPAGFPMDDCALYYGWYASRVTGPFTDPGFAFTPGAIAVHIHSFSASTLRNADANWVGPLLSKGAAASLGNVYEPFLQMTAHLDIFNHQLLKGFTLAESAYMATRALSWMTVVVGDPLYRPYLSWSQTDAKSEGKKPGAGEMYHAFALKNAEEDPKKYFAEARVAASRAENGPMLEDLGLMQAETGDFGTAMSCLQQARTIYEKRDDLLRVVVEQVDVLLQSNEKKKALALVHQTLRMVPDSPASGLLRQIEQKLNPPKPKPLPTPSPSPF
ncbi:MAG: TIGR03790 family protein, partial [Bryobacteraceae bacterium]